MHCLFIQFIVVHFRYIIIIKGCGKKNHPKYARGGKPGFCYILSISLMTSASLVFIRGQTKF